MPQFYDGKKFGAYFNGQFGVANAVTNKTAEDLLLGDLGGNSLIVAPQKGSVVGISVRSTAAVSAGSVIFKAHKDGTEFAQSGAPAPVLNTTNTNETYVSIRPGVLTFAAGEGLGVSYTSSTDAAPTNTNDYSVTLFYVLDPSG